MHNALHLNYSSWPSFLSDYQERKSTGIAMMPTKVSLWCQFVVLENRQSIQTGMYLNRYTPQWRYSYVSLLQNENCPDVQDKHVLNGGWHGMMGYSFNPQFKTTTAKIH